MQFAAAVRPSRRYLPQPATSRTGPVSPFGRDRTWTSCIRTSIWLARAPSRRCSSACSARAEGATIDEIVAATGWQPHTVRGAFAGALKKRLGLTIASEKVEGRGRVYHIAG